MLTYAVQVGQREWLADLMTRVDAKAKPLLSLITKGEPVRSMLMEYTVDDHQTPTDIAVPDGKDAESFDNTAENRALLQMYCMKVQDAAAVSDLAESVPDVAGLSKGELAEAIMKKLEKVSRAIECYIGGDQECQAGTNLVPYKFRGLGKWILSTAQATLPVNANYRTPAASIDATQVSTLTSALINGVITSVYGQTGVPDTNFKLVCGTTLKTQFSKLAEYSPAVSNTTGTRAYNTDWAGWFGTVVDQFRGDFGTVDLIPSLFNAHANFGGTAVVSPLRGYLIDPKLVSLHYKRYPRARQLEDRGGGPRFLVDAILGLRVKNPLGLGKFAATAA